MPADFTDFSKVKPLISSLISDNDKIVLDVKTDRARRKLLFDIEAMRNDRAISKDATILSMRVIDRNIKRSIPPHINYLITPPQPVYFFDEEGNKLDDITKEFSAKMQYTGWLLPLMLAIDSAKALGIGAIEVNFDPSKPGNVSFYHVSKDNLLIPKVKNIQTAPLCGIRFPLTTLTFEDLAVKNSFNSTHVKAIQDTYRDSTKAIEEEVIIYKLYFKIDNVVHVAWYNAKCDGYLKDPEPFSLGMFKPAVDELGMETTIPEVVDFYPIYILILDLNENEIIQSHEGMCKADAGVQEAVVSLWSSTVNAANRASNVYGSPNIKNVEHGTTPKVTELTLEAGRIYDTPMNLFAHPGPDESVVRSAQALDVWNLESNGQTSFAANNRVDSRKTAAEVAQASNLSASLTSTEVTMLSLWVEAIFTCAWVILQYRAARDLVSFLQIDEPIMTSLPMMEGIIQSGTTKKNDKTRILKTYTIKAAGDSEVIQKEERQRTRQNLLPTIQLAQSPALTQGFILDILKDALPEDAKRYESLMQLEAHYKQVAQNIYNVLQQAVIDPATGQPRPDIAPMMPQIEQLAKQVQ